MADRKTTKGMKLPYTPRPKARKLEVTDALINQIENMKAMGFTHEQVCGVLGIAIRTLQQYAEEHPKLRRALDYGKAKGVLVIANALFEKAKKGNVDAQKFYLRTQGQWSEKLELDVNHAHVIYETQLVDNKIRQHIKQPNASEELETAIIDITPDDECEQNELQSE